MNRLAELRAKTDWIFPKNRLSPTQLKTAENCMACYAERYVEGVPWPELSRLLIGRSVHEGIEKMRGLVMGDPETLRQAEPEGFAVEMALAKWDREVSRIEAEGLTWDLGSYGPSAADAARSQVEALADFAAPLILRHDQDYGLRAVEARALGLGLPIDQEEAQMGYEPVFPFQILAYVDAVHSAGSSDIKTADKKGDVKFGDMMQQMLYGIPWHRNGQDQSLTIHQIVKNKKLTPDCFRTFTMKPTAAQYDALEMKVLLLAERISNSMKSGLFEPNGSCWAKNHGFPKYTLIGG